MAIALSIFGVSFIAFSVWLAVRIVNRRERWATRTVAALLIAIVYPLSFGPACWWKSRFGDPPYVPVVYRPIGEIIVDGPESLVRSLRFYARLGMVSRSIVYVPCRTNALVRIETY